MYWTEKKTEFWLTHKSRTLTDRLGNSIVVEQSLLFWGQYDFLVEGGHFTEAQLIEFGHDTVEEFSLPFTLGLQDAVAHLFIAFSEGKESREL